MTGWAPALPGDCPLSHFLSWTWVNTRWRGFFVRGYWNSCIDFERLNVQIEGRWEVLGFRVAELMYIQPKLLGLRQSRIVCSLPLSASRITCSCCASFPCSERNLFTRSGIRLNMGLRWVKSYVEPGKPWQVLAPGVWVYMLDVSKDTLRVFSLWLPPGTLDVVSLAQALALASSDLFSYCYVVYICLYCLVMPCSSRCIWQDSVFWNGWFSLSIW